MAQFEISAPDGSKYQVDAPEGATEDDAIKYVQDNLGSLSKMAPAPETPAAPVDPAWQQTVRQQMSSLGSGIRDPIEAAAQGLTHILPEGVVRKGNELNNWLREQGLPLAEMPVEGDLTLDAQTKAREKEIEAERRAAGETGLDTARLLGNVISPTNYLVPNVGAVRLGGKLADAATRGLVAGALQPAASDDYIKEKERQALLGMLTGAGGTLATEGASKIIAPVVGKAQQALMDSGVQLTPGQIAGGILRRAEEAAKSFPILGSFIRGSEGRSVQGFNKAVINQALEPVGLKLPSTVGAGREAIDYAQHRLGEKYDNLLPKMNLTVDAPFTSDMQNLQTLATEMPAELHQQFDSILKNRVLKRLTPTGTMDGQALKQVESEIGHIASNYSSSADAAQRQLGSALNEVRSIIRDALSRQNPQEAQELQALNSAWAMFTRAQGAAARRATSGGVFTPGDLLQAVKSADKSVRKGAFARGDALMQDYAELGQMVLPSKLPDSGTTERALWDALGLSSALLKPEIPLSLGAASLPYTKVGTSLVNKYVQPGAARAAVGSALRNYSPMAAPAATALATRLGVMQPPYSRKTTP